MHNSASYVAMDAMIRQGWFQIQSSELEKTLDLLEKKGRITATEQKALLEVAKQISNEKAPYNEVE
ncbi:MAG TPA: hypothetical protein VK897_22120 [Anaerolineales bacterium]|nr:hypothetical protein [Anaerolineales bacterium]